MGVAETSVDGNDASPRATGGGGVGVAVVRTRVASKKRQDAEGQIGINVLRTMSVAVAWRGSMFCVIDDRVLVWSG